MPAKPGLIIHAWVVMTNHLHAICSCKEGKDLGLIWRDIKSFIAMKIVDAVINNSKESIKKNWLRMFEEAGTNNSRIRFSAMGLVIQQCDRLFYG